MGDDKAVILGMETRGQEGSTHVEKIKSTVRSAQQREVKDDWVNSLRQGLREEK